MSNNTDKLLRALIDALGFEIEEVKPLAASKRSPGVVYDMQTTYKVTKKGVDSISIEIRMVKEIIDILDRHSTYGDRNISYVMDMMSDLRGLLNEVIRQQVTNEKA